MKQLTQESLNDCPNWVESARIDEKGKLVAYSLEKSIVTRILNNEILLPWNCGILDSGYDTTNWQDSAINRNGYRCPHCNYFHVPHQCRESECINCYKLIV